MMVELKNGETLNGFLIVCDTWMNLTLREVTQTSAEGDRFVQLSEVYVRGNNVSENVRERQRARKRARGAGITGRERSGASTRGTTGAPQRAGGST